MKQLARAITLALCSFGAAASAQAASYVVMANGNSLDGKQLKQLQAAGGTIRASLPQIGVAIVDAEVDRFAARATKIGGIRSVTPDVVLQFEVPEAETVSEADFANPPNSGDDDTRFDLQWGHTAVDAAGAWNAGYRGAGAKVAVLDSGIACAHPDIAANLVHTDSASFVPDEGYCLTRVNAFNHGSHVAGTIASPDNGIGTIGVAPEAQIMAVKVLSEFTGSGSFGGIIEGIVHAVDHGADVINMSLGVRGGLPIGGSELAELVNATARATRYARANGTLVVASAGNDGRDLDHDAGLVCDEVTGECSTENLRAFPAQLPGVLAIAATAPVGWALDPDNTFLDNQASYTNYGQSAIDFSAPGGDAAYPGNENCLVAGLVRPCWVFDLVFSVGGYSQPVPDGPIFASYSWTGGTSMAAPHVSGVAALIYGKHGGNISPAQVEAILRASSDDLGKPGKDDSYGAGRVNAAKAVQY